MVNCPVGHGRRRLRNDWHVNFEWRCKALAPDVDYRHRTRPLAEKITKGRRPTRFHCVDQKLHRPDYGFSRRRRRARWGLRHLWFCGDERQSCQNSPENCISRAPLDHPRPPPDTAGLVVAELFAGCAQLVGPGVKGAGSTFVSAA